MNDIHFKFKNYLSYLLNNVFNNTSNKLPKISLPMKFIFIFFFILILSFSSASFAKSKKDENQNENHRATQKKSKRVVIKDTSNRGSEETRSERDRRLLRECKGRPNAGACLGYAS